MGIVAMATITKARTTIPLPTIPPPTIALALATTPTLVTILAETLVVEIKLDDENTLENESHSLV
jgi:hypothetical protein